MKKHQDFLPMEREWMDKFISHGYIDTLRHVIGDEPENTIRGGHIEQMQERIMLDGGLITFM